MLNEARNNKMSDKGLTKTKETIRKHQNKF